MNPAPSWPPNLAWVLRQTYHCLSSKDFHIATGAKRKEVDRWLKKPHAKVQKRYVKRLLVLAELLELLDGCDEDFINFCVRSNRKAIGRGHGKRSVLPKVRTALSEYQQTHPDHRSEGEGS